MTDRLASLMVDVFADRVWWCGRLSRRVGVVSWVLLGSVVGVLR